MSEQEVAYFGGGCFWCTEAIFEELRGVDSVVSGYAGGAVENPSYEQVSGGSTGHAEVTKITFDPAVIDYRTLLRVFFTTHDPTTLNRQGNDVGEQYRSIVLYASPAQKKEADHVIAELQEQKVYDKPFVTEVKPFEKFYEAEEYHQEYYRQNQNAPYCSVVINPKLAKFRKMHASLLKSAADA